jgi:hypothetical protein
LNPGAALIRRRAPPSPDKRLKDPVGRLGPPQSAIIQNRFDPPRTPARRRFKITMRSPSATDEITSRSPHQAHTITMPPDANPAKSLPFPGNQRHARADMVI